MRGRRPGDAKRHRGAERRKEDNAASVLLDSAETPETLVVTAQGTIVPAYGSGADVDAGNRSLAAPENEVAPMQ